MLHDDLLSALALKRHHPRQHLVQDHADRVDVNLLAVFALADLGGHIMKRPHGFGLPRTIIARDEFRQTIIADLNHPRVFITKHVPRLQIPMHNPVFVQISHPRRRRHKPAFNFFQRHPPRIGLDHVPQVRTRYILHHHPTLTKLIRLNVPQRNQVHVLQVQTIPNPAQLDVQVPLNLFQRNFFARVVQSKVNLPKSADTDPAFDRVAVQRPRAARVRESH